MNDPRPEPAVEPSLAQGSVPAPPAPPRLVAESSPGIPDRQAATGNPDRQAATGSPDRQAGLGAGHNPLPKIIPFDGLARCGDEVWIENAGQIYRLRRTRQGKLILTK